MTAFYVLVAVLVGFTAYGFTLAVQERRKHLRRQELVRRFDESLAALNLAPLEELNETFERFKEAIIPAVTEMMKFCSRFQQAHFRYEVLSDRSGNPVLIPKSFHRGG